MISKIGLYLVDMRWFSKSHMQYQESNLALLVSKTLELNCYALLPPQSLDW